MVKISTGRLSINILQTLTGAIQGNNIGQKSKRYRERKSNLLVSPGWNVQQSTLVFLIRAGVYLPANH